MDCSIVIPTYRRAAELAETLRALGPQVDPSCEVVVVCDGPDEPTRAFAGAYRPSFKLRWVFLPENRGQAAARNAGAGVACGELLFFLDDDTSPAPGWLEAHCRRHALATDPWLVVAGIIQHTYARPPSSHTEAYLRELIAVHQRRHEQAILGSPAGYRDFVWVGLNTSLHRQRFLATGGFDPALRYALEDMELGYRLSERGAAFCLEPAARVHHRSTKALDRYWHSAARETGEAEVYCRRQLGRPPTAASLLRAPSTGSPMQRMIHALAWRRPVTARVLAAISRRCTDVSGSRCSFRFWAAVTLAVGYWEGVSRQGVTRDNLRELLG